MEEVFIRNWNDLTDEQKAMAISNYQAVRSIEEEAECSWERAEQDAPYCRGYWILNGAVEIDI